MNIDIFNNDAFSLRSMTAAIERHPFKPEYLGTLGIFQKEPIRTTGISIEERGGVLNLIKPDQRGAPIAQRVHEKRNAQEFETIRIAKGDRLTASELQNVRAYGTESELMVAQSEVARRMSGPTGLRAEVELTQEHMRLGAIQGIVVDKDGDVIDNFFDRFGIVADEEIAFDLTAASPTSGGLRKQCTKLIRKMVRDGQGAFTTSSSVSALCGDEFFDNFIAHPEVRETYLNQSAASELRNDGRAFGSFTFGGITWHNYRGTDDETTVGIAADKVKFFPVNTRGVFRHVMAPGESFSELNSLGKKEYARTVPDPTTRKEYVDLEVLAYPLFMCTHPAMLKSGRAGD